MRKRWKQSEEHSVKKQNRARQAKRKKQRNKNQRRKKNYRVNDGNLHFTKKWKVRYKKVLTHLPGVLKWTFQVALVCLFAFVAVWYFGQRVSTVGDSMKPVLKNGDVVLVNRIVYNATKPKRGDIVVFKPKGNENSHYYIKRIVGMPGETVEILENEIYINGKKLKEDYKTTDIGDVGIVSEEIELGGDEYFVLGDDRENSEDSRSAEVGNVKRSYIYGKAWFVVSPKDKFGFIKE